MNANRIFTMIVRTVVNRLIRGSVNAGINKVAQHGKGSRKKQAGPNDQQRTQTAETQKRLRQSMRVARKMGRF